ncbi:MAG: response regulator [Dehalococcoidales bacterium]|nr:response regulator [Dehalococcoidales bacterium]
MVTGNAEILIVDDEPHLCDVLHRILTREGYQVRTAPDGETALELCRQKAPDVLLLDVMMPGMDGREVCRRVRESEVATHIIYFTARTDSAGLPKLRQLRHEADALIAKPCTTKMILSKVRNVLEGAL